MFSFAGPEPYYRHKVYYFKTNGMVKSKHSSPRRRSSTTPLAHSTPTNPRRNDDSSNLPSRDSGIGGISSAATTVSGSGANQPRARGLHNCKKMVKCFD